MNLTEIVTTKLDTIMMCFILLMFILPSILPANLQALMQPLFLVLIVVSMAWSFGQEWVMTFIASTSSCVKITLDESGKTFYAYLSEPLFYGHNTDTGAYQARCKTRYLVRIPNDTFYGNFAEFVLESSLIDLNGRLDFGKRTTVFMGIAIDHPLTAHIVCEEPDYATPESYKGAKVPVFRVIRSIGGDASLNIAPPTAYLSEILRLSKTIKEKIMEIIAHHKRMENQVNNLSQQVKYFKNEAERAVEGEKELRADFAAAESKLLTIKSMSWAKALEYYEMYGNFDKAIKNQFKSLKEKLFSWPFFAVIATVSFVALAFGKPELFGGFGIWLEANRTFVAIMGIIMLAGIYLMVKFVGKRSKKT